MSYSVNLPTSMCLTREWQQHNLRVELAAPRIILRMAGLQQFIDYVYRFPECQTCVDTLRKLTIEVHRMEPNELEFDIIGLKPFVVNAIRQTILNDIPTVAIEDVYFHKNSSIFNCDYISQRLALVPIKADPNDFKFVYNADMSRLDSDNTVVFNLNESNTEKAPVKVYSRSLVWEPIGEKQGQMPPIEPLFDNIPLLCLKPNEEISCRIFCVKGLGRQHMKFSPGFARYCFLSKIDILNPEEFTNEMALTLKESFPRGVIDLRPMPNGRLMPFVADARLDRHSRSFKNDENVEKNTSAKYYRDHMIFSVESYGVIEPAKMVISALSILKYKYTFWKQIIEQAKSSAPS